MANYFDKHPIRKYISLDWDCRRATVAINDVKVWHTSRYPKETREYRVYVHMADGREGCLYITGNKYNAKMSTDGKLTDAEWAMAREMASDGKVWKTTYATTKTYANTYRSGNYGYARRQRCPDCGGWCEHECEANRWPARSY